MSSPSLSSALLLLLLTLCYVPASSQPGLQLECDEHCSAFVEEVLQKLYSARASMSDVLQVHNSIDETIDERAQDGYGEAPVSPEGRYCDRTSMGRVQAQARAALRNPELNAIFRQQKRTNYPQDPETGDLLPPIYTDGLSNRLQQQPQQQMSVEDAQLAEAKRRYAIDLYCSFYERDMCQVRQFLLGFFTHVTSPESSHIPHLHMGWVSFNEPQQFDEPLRALLQEICCRFGLELVREKLRLYNFPLLSVVERQPGTCTTVGIKECMYSFFAHVSWDTPVSIPIAREL